MTTLEKKRHEEELQLRNDLRTRERDFTKLYGKPKKMTAGELVAAAKAAGQSSLGIENDLELEALVDLHDQVVPVSIQQPALGTADTLPGCNCQECRRQLKKAEDD